MHECWISMSEAMSLCYIVVGFALSAIVLMVDFGNMNVLEKVVISIIMIVAWPIMIMLAIFKEREEEEL